MGPPPGKCAFPMQPPNCDHTAADNLGAVYYLLQAGWLVVWISTLGLVARKTYQRGLHRSLCINLLGCLLSILMVMRGVDPLQLDNQVPRRFEAILRSWAGCVSLSIGVEVLFLFTAMIQLSGDATPLDKSWKLRDRILSVIQLGLDSKHQRYRVIFHTLVFLFMLAVLGLKHNPVGIAVMEVIYLAFVAVFAIAATYHISVIHNRLRSTPNLRINHQAAERNIKTARRLKWVMAGISIIVAIAFFVLLSRLPKRIEKRDRVEYVGTIGIREVIPRLFANFAMWLTAVLLVFYFFAHYDSQRDQRSSSAPGPSTTGQIPGTPGTPSALLREYSSTPASKIRAITGHASPSASSKETDVELTPRPELLQMARPVEVPTAQV